MMRLDLLGLANSEDVSFGVISGHISAGLGFLFYPLSGHP